MKQIEIRKHAKKITLQRSLVPDIKFVFFAVVLSLTVVGMPIAYSIIKEYHAYLNNARENYVPGADKKGIIYPYKEPMQMLFSYNFKAFLGTLKAIAYIFYPSACFFKVDKLSERQNFDLNLSLSSLKFAFADIFVSVAAIVTLFVLIFCTSFYYNIAEVCGMLLINVLMFRRFVTYCQALVLFEKIANDRKPEDEAFINEK